MPGLLLQMDSQGAPFAVKVPEYGFVVSHQKLHVEIDFSTQSLKGHTEITILPQTRDLRTIRIDARQCKIPQGNVTVNNFPTRHVYGDPLKALAIPNYVLWNAEQYDQQRERLIPLIVNTRANGALLIPIPKTVGIEEVDPFSNDAATAVTQRALGASASRHTSIAVDSGSGPFSATTPTLTPKTAAEQSSRFQPLVISIHFSTTHFREGLHFVGLNEGDGRFPHVYSKHSPDPGTAPCIFPCVDDPVMRCTWEISITCSRTLGDAVKRRPMPKGAQSKKPFTNGVVNGVAIEDDYDVPLTDDEKLLEMAVVCSGETMNEIDDPNDSSKKIVSFVCSNIVAAHHIGFAIGPFEQVDLAEYREDEDGEKLGQGQALPLFGYCLPGRSHEVRHVCLAMAHALDWFMLTFGAYPFSDYNLVFVDDQVNDTVHTASLSICSNRLLFGPDIIDPEMENTRAIVHAIASQWIGVSVVANQRVDRWLTIGLSHFMTGLFMKTICGNNDYMFRQKMLTDKLVELDVDRPSIHALGEILHLGAFEMDFMTLKAPLVLFILDKRIFKATGTAGITRVISKIVTNANIGASTESVVSTESFRRLCEKITKYRQTEPFWNQWILGAGCPKFVIGQKFNKKRLCVEMTISQKQESTPAGQKLEKGSFMREFKEDIHGVYAGELQSVFTGPMTIRIHEADGTPYEHIVEIREGIARIEIPYNTKYKRLKRSRRQKERLNAGGPMDVSGEGGEDALYYCLGDVLQSQSDIREWGLVDWDADAEAKMDAESYEWMRIDADFEWLCDKKFTSMPPYMYVSQLQQDRDVVAQQDSMLYLKAMNPHPLVSTILIRTVMDTRYFHGIRTMAVECLKTHANVACNWVGLRHLEKACSEFFCYPGTMMPRSNDFNDRRSYKVELAIPQSMSNIRDDRGNCPKEARQFILDQLRFNDNTNNEYSDNFKIASLLSALANSLIPAKAEENALHDLDPDEDEDMDPEPTQFRKMVIDELDRHRRMDEWINSYHNIFTTTVMDCKLRLMKVNVIPLQPTEFAQYLHDGTSEHIRIKAFEALVELGLMTNDYVLKLLLNVLSTDPSPYVRNHLFEVFCLGLAFVAFAEGKPEYLASVLKEKNVLDEGDDGLVVEQDSSSDQGARKAYILRTTSIEGALAALSQELQNNLVLRGALWEAINSPVIGVNEQVDLLDICGFLYDAVESMVIKLRLPRYWKVNNLGKGHLQFEKSDNVRMKPMPRIIVESTPAPTPTPGSTTTKLATSRPPSASPAPTPRPGPPPQRLSFHTNSGAMKPPKRPLERTPSEDVQPRRKIIKLNISGAKLDAIQRLPPNPTIGASSSSTNSASPAPRPSTAPKPSPAPRPSPMVPPSPVPSATSASPAAQPASGAPAKVRKPLPDAAPRPHKDPTPPPPQKQKLKIKLTTKPKVLPGPEVPPPPGT